MTKLLSPAAVERYRRDGFLFPIPILTPAQARECRRQLEAIEGEHAGALRHKPHLHGVDILLRAGEMSLHHVRMVHGSPPNRSDDRRIGLAVRYIATHVKQLEGEDGALLVRGVDDYRHFAPERAPASDLSADALAQHAESKARSTKILYRGTGVGRVT